MMPKDQMDMVGICHGYRKDMDKIKILALLLTTLLLLLLLRLQLQLQLRLDMDALPILKFQGIIGRVRQVKLQPDCQPIEAHYDYPFFYFIFFIFPFLLLATWLEHTTLVAIVSTLHCAMANTLTDCREQHKSGKNEGRRKSRKKCR